MAPRQVLFTSSLTINYVAQLAESDHELGCYVYWLHNNISEKENE